MPLWLVAFAAAVQLLPDAWNVTPIGAVGLFAGARCDPRVAWSVPLAALAIADLALGFYTPVVMACVYLGYLAGPLVGRVVLATHRAPPRLAGAVVLSAMLFFLVSNLGNWLAYFPHTPIGLLECYLRGLPYLGTSLLGDTFYAALLFGADALARRANLHRAHVA